MALHWLPAVFDNQVDWAHEIIAVYGEFQVIRNKAQPLTDLNDHSVAFAAATTANAALPTLVT
jgi:hypothetical protein